MKDKNNASDYEKLVEALKYIHEPQTHDDYVELACELASFERGEELYFTKAGDSKKAVEVWRSISRKPGNKTFASLLARAVRAGFNLSQWLREKSGSKTVVPDAKDESQKAAMLAQRVWDVAYPISSSNPYFVRKGLEGIESLYPTLMLRECHVQDLIGILGYHPQRGGERLQGSLLVVPLSNARGELTSIEFIDGSGRKSALAGGVKSGSAWYSRTGEFSCIGIAEGVATVLSGCMGLTNPLPIAVMGNTNLVSVTASIRKDHPSTDVYIFADLDKKTGGPDKLAVKAARDYGCKLVVPPIKSPSASNKDINDLLVSSGVKSVAQACIDASVPELELPTIEPVQRKKHLAALDEITAHVKTLIDVRYNLFSGVIEVISRKYPSKDERTFTDTDIVGIQYNLALMGYIVSKDNIFSVVSLMASHSQYNPVVQHLNSLPPPKESWDEIIEAFLEATGVEITLYSVEVVRRWFIGVVARCLDPGCQRDDVLLLQGEQGVGKSHLARSIAEAFAPKMDAFVEISGDLGSKDSKIALKGKVIGELSELSSLNKSSIEIMKGFITSPVDKYRPPFGKMDIAQKRTISFIGTTNDDAPLKDATGNRRFLPLHISRIDRPRLDAVLPLLVASSVRDYLAGEKWYLTGELQKQASIETAMYQEADVWERKVLGIVSGKSGFTSEEVVREVAYSMQISDKDLNKGHLMRVTGILRKNGYQKKQSTTGKRAMLWYPPDSE